VTTVAITAAGRGLGLELVRSYAAGGDRVFAFCRDPAKTGTLQQIAHGSGGRVTVLTMDVASDSSVAAGVAAIGDAPVDVLLNVAAIVGNGMPELEFGSSDWNSWQEVLNTVTMGPLRVLQAFLPRLRRGDKVINITSQVGTSMWRYGGTYAYGAAKAALDRLTLSVSLDLAPRGIIVGLVHPGWMNTDMGGPDAETPVEESAAGIRRIVADWPADGQLHFLKWTGEPQVW
jgi:NAD(P)-dependent dehydrogenase (short-subunit alcohol dehydrogenase family)